MTKNIGFGMSIGPVQTVVRVTSLSKKPRNFSNNLRRIAVRIAHYCIEHLSVANYGRNGVSRNAFGSDIRVRDDNVRYIIRRQITVRGDSLSVRIVSNSQSRRCLDSTDIASPVHHNRYPYPLGRKPHPMIRLIGEESTGQLV